LGVGCKQESITPNSEEVLPIWRGARQGVPLALKNRLGACDCCRRFGLLGCGGLCGLGLPGLSLLRLLSLLLGGADLHAAFQNGSILNADALRDHITCQRALAADVQAVCALDVALHLAQDYDFAATDVGGDASVVPNGDAVTGKINGALDSAIDVQRFGTADFTFDDQRAPDGRLFHWDANRLGLVRV
jgi:hypothetical protein